MLGDSGDVARTKLRRILPSTLSFSQICIMHSNKHGSSETQSGKQPLHNPTFAKFAKDTLKFGSNWGSWTSLNVPIQVKGAGSKSAAMRSLDYMTRDQEQRRPQYPSRHRAVAMLHVVRFTKVCDSIYRRDGK